MRGSRENGGMGSVRQRGDKWVAKIPDPEHRAGRSGLGPTTRSLTRGGR
jgi:hypothetical protein